MDRRMLDYSPESEAFEAAGLERGAREWSGATSAEAEVFGEVDEMELAAGLLEVTNEAELDRFLGHLIDRAGRAVGRAARSPEGQALGAILKDAAKRALPAVARVIDQRFGVATGANVGAQVVRAAGRYLGLELEGLSPEDQELEAAKRFVRFGAEAAKNATGAHKGVPLQAAARSAMIRAARRYAPGLLHDIPDPSAANPGARFVPAGGGRWVRRGHNIIVIAS